MAKSITFSVKLNVDGKEQLVAATANVKNLREVVRSMDSPMQGLLKQFNSWGFAFQNISSAANGIASSLNSLTAESRSFGGAMAAANTMAGKSGEDFTNLKTQVAELSKTIPVARDQLANGLYQVISNGVPEDNWIEYLEKSAKASVGGIANLEEVVKVTSTVIKNYGLAWGDAGTIQDKIQLTAKNGVTSFEQMAQALPRVTANASTLGVSVDELMASFATLTGVSGNTAEVSTQLAAIFTALIKPSGEASKMAQQMGIQFDAAAIKAAGGMKNFLTQLNADVKRYAAASGMLEQEVYGKLFGSAESLRAITPLVGNLADKFEENVNAMAGSAGTIDGAFETMGNTGSAQLQKLNNALGEYTDILQGSIGNFLPYVNFTSQMITTAASVGTLMQSLKSLGLAGKAVSVVIETFGPIVQVASAAMRGAAVSANTLKLAIRGLMVSTGVGVAVWALYEAFSYLSSGSDKAASSVSELSQAQQEAKQAHEQLNSQIAQQNAALDINIQKLKNFKGSKTDEKKLVDEMNTTYGSAMGYYSSVAQWYTALTTNSKAYCQQMINEITIRDLANQAAKEQQTRHDIMYDENGKTRKYSKQRKTRQEKYENYTTGGGVDRGYRTVEIAGSSDQEKASAAATASYRREQALKKRMETLVKKNQSISFTQTEGYSATPPSATVPTTPKTSPARSGSGSGKTTITNNTPATGSIDWYEKAIDDKRKELNATADAATAKALNAEMEGLQRSLYMLKVKVGIETPPGSDIQSEIKPLTETVIESFEDMQERIRKNPIHVETDPEGLEKMKRKMEDLENVQMLGGTNIQSFESVKRSMESINSITDPTVKGFAAAGDACSTLGSAMQQLGADSAAAKAGMVMAAIGQIALSFAQAMTSAANNWITWLAFGIAGTAQMISMIATISGFAKGGVVGGSSTTGDKVPVRVNSGEMILTKTQQARLFAIANGDERPKMTLPDYSLPKLTLNTSALGELNRQGTESQTVRFRLEGRSLVGALANETRVNSRSGRRSNIVI